MLYWPVLSEAELMHVSPHWPVSRPRLRPFLDRTADMVTSASRQPESDHFITWEKD